ncbi:GatB/YqeY domain-containing protein [Candidatus Parcubacteria bacterium]|nr:GatB/YqeY domain-containing protein [Candidatus Parcubacteria bacterium]
MTLQQKIRGEIKGAMLAKDKVRLNVLRGLVTAFVNEVIAQKRKPQEELVDEDALNVIRRGVKQRKYSIEQFKAGGRADLVASEEAELTILQTFLPATMSKEDIRAVAEKKRAEMGITDKSKLGIFMGTVMKELKGKADGADVKEVVEAMFI